MKRLFKKLIEVSKCGVETKDQQRTERIRANFRSSHQKVFLRKGVLKICSKFIGEHPCRSATSIKLQQLYLTRTSAWVFSCKFAAYFQNTFSLGIPLGDCFCNVCILQYLVASSTLISSFKFHH